MKGLNKPKQKMNYKNNKKKKKKNNNNNNKQTTRSLSKLCSEVFPNSAPVATILRGGLPSMEEEKKRKK